MDAVSIAALVLACAVGLWQRQVVRELKAIRHELQTLQALETVHLQPPPEPEGGSNGI